MINITEEDNKKAAELVKYIEKVYGDDIALITREAVGFLEDGKIPPQVWLISVITSAFHMGYLAKEKEIKSLK